MSEKKLPWLDAFGVVVAALPSVSSKLRREGYKDNPNPLAGCCYAASEAIYHLSSDPLEAWSLRFGSEPHKTHWYLRHAETRQVIDPTASQFPAWNFRPFYWDGSSWAAEGHYNSIYELGKRKGFLTKGPSKRAKIILDAIDLTDIYFREQETTVNTYDRT